MMYYLENYEEVVYICHRFLLDLMMLGLCAWYNTHLHDFFVLFCFVFCKLLSDSTQAN